MPNCRNCGTRLTKFDKDICPVCGTTLPLKGVKSETIEITSEIDLTNPEFNNYLPKKRTVTFVLFALLGFSGAPLFYLNKTKAAIIWLLANVLIGVGLFFLLSFAFTLGTVWGGVITGIAIFVGNIIPGLYYLIKSDLKDGRGEFIR